MRFARTMFSVLVMSGFLASVGFAQGGTFPNENHYKVYEVPESPSFAGDMRLDDQFGSFMMTFVVLDKFANPANKNQEGIVDSLVHQTWWIIDDPEPVRRVEIDNQFGRQTWHTFDGRYLVLPAIKNPPPPPQPPPPDFGNHYKCYDALGPPINASVTIDDQFGPMDAVLTDPVYFCNPVHKTVDGVQYNIVDPEAHLACYHIDPPMTTDFPLVAVDQFGVWDLTAILPEWLCVPTTKLTFVAAEDKLWGDVKKLYKE